MKYARLLHILGMGLGLVGIVAFGWWFFQTQQTLTQQAKVLAEKEASFESTTTELIYTKKLLDETKLQLATVEGADQFQENRALEAEMAALQRAYREAVSVYESLLEVRPDFPKSQALDTALTKALVSLSQRRLATATAQLADVRTKIAELRSQQVAGIPTNVPVNSSPPGSGHRRQTVETGVGSFVVDIIAADLNSTRVVVETASDGDCRDNCPVASLADYVGRAGGFAGINGPYFCPAEYPSCAGKTNSFDTLIMNRKKTYFNSDNNVYSTVPAFIFTGNSARLVGQSLEWGRDTGVDSVIASQPMLLSGGEIRFGGDGDPKKGSRGSRSFIGTKGSTVYIGVVRGATVAEVSHVLKTLGLENALNLDSGGSTALMNGGSYLAGPGRATPFGIVFVRK